VFFGVRQDRTNQLVYREAEQMNTRLQQVFRRGFISYMGALKKRANHEILHGKKTGRVYVVRLPSGRRRRHQSSAPGETHANLTGKLRKSLSWKVHGWQKAEFGYGVAVKASNAAPFYAPWLEFGTKRMQPRPSLGNAIEAEPVEAHFNHAFDAEFR
jgi:hypothetical protein